MTNFDIGIIGIIVLFITLFSGMPIGIGMGLVGFVGVLYLTGFDSALGLLRTVPYRTFASYDLSIIPLFILMGQLCFYAGLSKDLYRTVYTWTGGIRGGLAMATVGACAGFAAVSGSSVATAATMGTVALPEMKRYKYDDSLATGAVAAGGTIGILIPPSITLVLYGVITEQSIGKLLLAGFIPGILQAAFYMILIYILCKRNEKLGPAGPSTSLVQKILSLRGTWIVIVLFLIVIGGIYLGIFSPTEAAGVGAFGAFFLSLATRRLNWSNFKESVVTTGTTAGMILLIITGAMVLGYFLAITRVPFILAEAIGKLAVSPYLVLACVLVIYIFLGCIMDALAMMLIATPIFYPVVLSAGFDPIVFGVLVTRVVEIGMITPPVGMNVFVIKGIAKDVPMYTIFRGIVPFLIADFFHVALIVAVPRLSLFLPSFMK